MTMASTNRPTIAEIRRWPATVSIRLAASALGVSRSHAYECVRRGTFPARTVAVGERVSVVTSSILELLGEAPQASSDAA